MMKDKNITRNICDSFTIQVYPILFPCGDPGWHEGLEHTEQHRTVSRFRVTMLQYYSYRLAIRPTFSTIHRGGKLFQQYLVDAYVKMEGTRLDWIRQNQGQLRMELYSGLMDHLNTQAADLGVHPGRMVILPSTFQVCSNIVGC